MSPKKKKNVKSRKSAAHANIWLSEDPNILHECVNAIPKEKSSIPKVRNDSQLQTGNISQPDGNIIPEKQREESKFQYYNVKPE